MGHTHYKYIDTNIGTRLEIHLMANICEFLIIASTCGLIASIVGNQPLQHDTMLLMAVKLLPNFIILSDWWQCSCRCTDRCCQSSWKTSQHMASQSGSGKHSIIIIIFIDIPTHVDFAYIICTQVPEITNYTMVNRTYRYFQGVPLFPFGYGLYVVNVTIMYT